VEDVYVGLPGGDYLQPERLVIVEFALLGKPEILRVKDVLDGGISGLKI